MLTDEQKRTRAETRHRTAALRAEEDALRREAKRCEWHEEDMFLTREQAAAGELCRGCGLEVIDGLGSWPPLMHLSPEQRIEHDAAETRYKQLHPDCRAHRWSIDGSRTTHCGLCCPPVPFSRSQLDAVAKILDGHVRRDEELDIWALDLTCGHRVEHNVHHTQRYWVGSTTHCPECSMTRGIVTSERNVEAADRKKELEQRRAADVTKAEREVAKAEKAAAAAREKLAALKAGQ
ncbi:hypothetical protein M2152_000952 [Microbacteriaceae bacterium SG_E_30_P1]|uniref:HNH endonuclease n=1 Tax=Antiquaquibacter oligotrophicus TaxID=2880260 RepID=A0ABT6KLA9_9MICO|nr:hypothetical protein [Antiquaquibacter oligotrophicus]MDH6180770.1 hypothetical protein [Antiquaquibacter oligotrophicus]UDF13511.1 hypothetical protein LH407_01225 [Antiquaquibacter oligotrophicus]